MLAARAGCAPAASAAGAQHARKSRNSRPVPLRTPMPTPDAAGAPSTRRTIFIIHPGAALSQLNRRPTRESGSCYRFSSIHGSRYLPALSYP
jgi:hypothetical protein